MLALQFLVLPGCGKSHEDRVFHADHRAVLTDVGLALSVAPTGDALALTWSSGFGAIVDVHSGRLSFLPGKWASRCSWSPDGRRFTALEVKEGREATSRRVVWVDAAKLSPNGVTPWSKAPPNPDAAIYTFPRWSDNPEQFYYQATDCSVSLMDPISIHAASVKGGDRRMVVGSLVWVERCCAANQLLFKGAVVQGERAVYVLDMGTGGRREVLSDEHVETVSLSPRGNLVAALCLVSPDSTKSMQASRARLLVAGLDTAKSAVLAEGTFATMISWSPDSSTIALSRLTAGANGASADDWTPLAMRVTGGQAHLSDIGRGRDLQWGSDGAMYWISLRGVMAMNQHGKPRTVVRFPLEGPR